MNGLVFSAINIVWSTVITLILLALSAITAGAQVIDRGPVPTGAKLTWEAPENITVAADAQTYEARVSRNGTPMTALVNVTCRTGVVVNRVTCDSVLTASNLDALNQAGVHTLTLKLFRPDVGETAASAPFVLTTPAGVPTGLRIER